MNYKSMELMRTAKFLTYVATNETIVDLWELDIEIGGERLFVIRSRNVKTMKEYIRYGNKIQAMSILNTYKKEKRFNLE